MLEIDWKEVTVTFNDNKLIYQELLQLNSKDKVKVRHLMKRKPLLFHLMLKQGITWFTFAAGLQETLLNDTTTYKYYKKL